jgi:hypothetical protein
MNVLLCLMCGAVCSGGGGGGRYVVSESESLLVLFLVRGRWELWEKRDGDENEKSTEKPKVPTYF